MTHTSASNDFGARLRDAREQRDLSLRVIADTTKISVRALEALERNDISKLPGGIFSRAFVRAYAIEVGLDPEQTIAEFITRFPDEIVTQGHPRSRAHLDELERDSRASHAHARLSWGAILIVAILVVLVAYFALVRRSSATTDAPTTAPAIAR